MFEAKKWMRRAALATTLACAALSAVGANAAASATGASLPGGASSLNETYKDWQVSCVQQADQKRCAIIQTQTQQSGQRVLAVELSPPVDKKVSGNLILPFGLALDKGVSLQIDDKPRGQPRAFQTCLPAGCVVPLSLDAPTLAALRGATALKLKAVAVDGQEVSLSISLNGFPEALDRISSLGR